MSVDLGPEGLGLFQFYGDEWLPAALISSVAYGAVSVLFSICFYTLGCQFLHKKNRRYLFLLIFISAVYILCSIFMGAVGVFARQVVVGGREAAADPGPLSFEFFDVSETWVLAGEISFLFTNWSTDALITWRCMVLYRGCGRYRVALICTLSALCLGSLGYACWMITVGIITSFSSITILSITLAINVISTVAITIRLLLFYHRIVHALGQPHGIPYMRIIAISVESASLYSAFVMCTLVSYAMQSPIGNVFFLSLGHVQTIASFLIILRVAQGKDAAEESGEEMVAHARRAVSAVPLPLSGIRLMRSGEGISTIPDSQSVLDIPLRSKSPE